VNSVLIVLARIPQPSAIVASWSRALDDAVRWRTPSRVPSWGGRHGSSLWPKFRPQVAAHAAQGATCHRRFPPLLRGSRWEETWPSG
jgi:hypothetical protein